VKTAADYSPGDVFEVDTRFGALRVTLLELNDDVYRAEVEAGPTASGGPPHRHLHQQERFLVHDGTLRVRTGLRGSRLCRAVSPRPPLARSRHTDKVESDERARFTVEFAPSLQVADYFLELSELKEPGLRDLARPAREYPREHFYLPVIPPRLQRALLRPLA